ncbi:MAG: WecB/TagA/CpsF family glycosyltransferase [Clostridiales bacterium]|jgi:N-acetylglucosaminyldiphosphoundecaprenol N-acetyl-beta-D-mannosaminyltransferase|nr:WecB/TagA/CpsF family glycosyltransferase [Clostridiales bacterium]
MKKESYLGVNVCDLDMKKAIEEIDTIIERKEPSFVVAINPEKIMKAEKDEKLLGLLNRAAIQIPDGVGVVIASKLKGGNIRTRVTGIDLMYEICGNAAKKGHKVYLLGAKPGVAEQAGGILKERYEGLNILGIRDGYFKDENEVLLDIIAKAPDILFVAMGSPKQEYWITEHMDNLKIPLLMGVGGSFDVTCGNIKRAPEWMCRLGLEWFYRLVKEPWRFKRMLVLPQFLFRVLLKR